MSLTRTPDLADVWVYDGGANGDEMGYAVGTAGDINRDGYDDLVLGAPGATIDVYREGVVSLFNGGAGGMPTLPNWVVRGNQKGSRFGAAVGPAGDVNGDGYDDLVIGAPEYNNGTSKAGAVMVFHGSFLGLPSTPDWTYYSPVRETQLGNAVAGGGNLNGDAYDDLVVGARWYTGTLSSEGSVLVFYGSGDGLSANPDLQFLGGQAGATLGYAVAGGGDVNGDGYDDVLAGAPGYNEAVLDQGAAYLYLGGPGGVSTAPDWTAYGEEEGSRLGAAVAWAGDLNDDGYDDLAVGAPGDSVNVLRGSVHVYYGSATGPGPSPDVVIKVSQIGSGFGYSLARAGDMNVDGYDDLLAGAYRYQDDQRDEGGAFLFFGSPRGIEGAPGWAGFGDKADASYGFAVASAGTVDSSGFLAIAVGAPTYKLDDKTPKGRAVVHFGPLEPESRDYHVWLPLIIRQPTP